jgi:hypothetical protein
VHRRDRGMALKAVEDNQRGEDSEGADRIRQHMRDGTLHRCHSWLVRLNLGVLGRGRKCVQSVSRASRGRGESGMGLAQYGVTPACAGVAREAGNGNDDEHLEVGISHG